MKWTANRIMTLGAVSAALGFWLLVPEDSGLKEAAFWQSLATPGHLSAAHAHLEDDCASCHTSVLGVEASSCIMCHANNESLLQRQPTAFHASVASCRECHVEHGGRSGRPTTMNHRALVQIGLRRLEEDKRADSEKEQARQSLLRWIGTRRAPPHDRITREEAALNCAACHANDDPHYRFFGSDCAQCHGTDKWTIPEYRHPSPRSMDCAQCHQAPPSHHMMHFKMISARVADQHHAEVRQCHLCHQTTSWNDILGVGLYKHH